MPISETKLGANKALSYSSAKYLKRNCSPNWGILSSQQLQSGSLSRLHSTKCKNGTAVRPKMGWKRSFGDSVPAFERVSALRFGRYGLSDSDALPAAGFQSIR